MSEKRLVDPDRVWNRAWRKLLLLSVLLFAGVCALVLTAIWAFGYPAVRSAWEQARSFVVPAKWVLLIASVHHWPELIRWAAERWNMEDGYRDYLLALRWRFAAGLLVLELLFGQNLIGRLTA